MNHQINKAVQDFYDMLNKRYEHNRQVDWSARVESVTRNSYGQVTSVIAKVQDATGTRVAAPSNQVDLYPGALIAVENLGTIGAPVWAMRAGVMSGAALPGMWTAGEGYELPVGSIDEGDVLWGSPEAGQPNWFYDQSEGTFSGRIGTNAVIVLDAESGTGTFGGSVVASVGELGGWTVRSDGIYSQNDSVQLLSDVGIVIKSAPDVGDITPMSLKWRNGATLVAELFSYASGLYLRHQGATASSVSLVAHDSDANQPQSSAVIYFDDIIPPYKRSVSFEHQGISPVVEFVLGEGSTPTGHMTLQQGAEINESGADSDTRVEGNTDANLLFVDAGADKVGISTNAPTMLLSVDEKVGMTPDGGLAVKCVAGENLSRGEIVYVKIASGADGKLWKTVYSDGESIQMPVGFVYADALADADVWIVTGGIAYALPESGITAARGNVAIVSNAESGRVEQSATVPVAEHWREVGHWLDTGSGNGVLTRLFVHFN